MKWGVLIATLFLVGTSWSQVLRGVISHANFLIGEPVTLTYSVKADIGDSIEFIPENQKIATNLFTGGQLTTQSGELEIIDAFTDTFSIQKGRKIWVGQYTVTAWDSGAFVIPGPKIRINDSVLQFDDIRIFSDYTEKLKGVDMYDIRENYADIPEEKFSITKFVESYWWLLAVIFGIVIVIVFFARRKPTEPVRIVKAMSLKDRTLHTIDALEKQNLWESDRLKEHFVELSYIVRSYLTSRYDISLLEKTTFETKILLLQKGLNEDTVDNIIRILYQSDMVKFAKSKPERIEILKISTLARQIIAETSPLEFDNYE